MNLLHETLEILEDNGKSFADIQWVGTSTGEISLASFLGEADTDYDDSYGIEEVNLTLVVVGNDWWLERHEYDGSEWWEYKEKPEKPKRQVASADVEHEIFNDWYFRRKQKRW